MLDWINELNSIFVVVASMVAVLFSGLFAVWHRLGIGDMLRSKTEYDRDVAKDKLEHNQAIQTDIIQTQTLENGEWGTWAREQALEGLARISDTVAGLDIVITNMYGRQDNIERELTSLSLQIREQNQRIAELEKAHKESLHDISEIMRKVLNDTS